MSSIWAAIAGGANEYLRQSQTKEEDARWEQKQNFLAELEKQRMEIQQRMNQSASQEQREWQYGRDLQQQEITERRRREDMDRDERREAARIEREMARDRATAEHRNRSLSLQERALEARTEEPMRGSDVRGYEESANEAMKEIKELINPIDSYNRPLPVDGGWKSQIEEAMDEAVRIPDPRVRYEKLSFLRRVAALGPKGR